MRGLGTIINALAIVIGGVLGILFKRFLKERYQDTIIKATGFSVVFLGAVSCSSSNVQFSCSSDLRWLYGHDSIAGVGCAAG